jgi:hypothetical protein
VVDTVPELISPPTFPLTSQLTLEFVEFITVATNCNVAPVWTATELGKTVTEIDGGGGGVPPPPQDGRGTASRTGASLISAFVKRDVMECRYRNRDRPFSYET